VDEGGRGLHDAAQDVFEVQLAAHREHRFEQAGAAKSAPRTPARAVPAAAPAAAPTAGAVPRASSRGPASTNPVTAPWERVSSPPAIALPQPDLRVRDAVAVLRPRLPPVVEGRLEDALVPDWLLLRVGDAVFLAGVFFAADFFAAADLPVVALAAVDPAPADLAAVFLAPVARFSAAVFVAAVFVAVVFVAVVPAALAVVFLAGAVRAVLVPSAPCDALPSPFFPSRPRGCVSQATAAPVTATGHSTSPATPATPAPV
ncbi:hypothetical protein, partial [Streptomyces sp. NPDC052535]|uniref:hypothetical protein n=1 Tax=Streptomyces sp. NPDC052535 TaxID=3155531 RepID=UPI0034123B87